ncbi:hypothetical protein [Stieleria marina]|uniref:Uncharacterized protein n=1 Tax=Stieleria marina TaxID=1930275 RepID=A0A517NYP0_9BACT|nr:hypothetical protein K239x_42470 [Planctomycetes bacterium K23_9]
MNIYAANPKILIAQSDLPSGELLWGAPTWLLPTAVIGAVVAALVVWNYSQRGIVAPVRLFATLLKLAAIGLIALCLLQPMRSGTRPRPQANVMPILIDNSQSMQLKTTDAVQSRGDRARTLLDETSDWRVRLAQAFDVRTYGFDARLENIASNETLEMDGNVSSLTGSLTALAQRFADRPVGGTILFTDGNLTDSPSADFDWSSLGFPVYPVLPADDAPVRDLRIADISTRQTDFESAPITLRIKIDAVAMGSAPAIVQLRDQSSGRLIQEQSVPDQLSTEPQQVTFRFRPEQSGIQFYRVIVFTEDDRATMEDAASDLARAETREATLANNQRLVTVDRTSGPYRILYLAGRPNWEFKFIRRALQEDAEVQLVGLLRIADKEPKFSFRDQGVSSTNPLFQGLGDEEEDAAQQYDQQVIIRLGVQESEELSEGFPESPEELFAYHGLILDDIEPEFFTQDQLLLIRRFVAARGGGLLMLGGQESFAGKSFADSPLGELSPVYAARSVDLTSPREGQSFKMQLTREGLLQPWARLRETESAELGRLAEMPAFTTINPVGEIKPGASQLAVAKSADGETVPALLAQRFGKGRSAAIPIGDLWRWSMRRDDTQRDDPAQAWRQLMHYLVNEVPRRAEIKVRSAADPNQPVTIVATARDEDYLPLDNANVQFTIDPPDGEPFTIKAEPDDQTPGQYLTTYWSREPGAYRVTASITQADGNDVGEAASGWTAQSNAAEFRQLQLNRDLLKRIADQTGGEIIAEDRLSAFVTDLPNRKVPVTETWIYPIWHRPWVMFLAMLCLCAEWGIRRLRGLA